MATTTNYGWTTPDDTALVKDGAAAIRSLGTAIDTSMNTALGTKKAGLVLLNTTSFSAVSSQSLPANTFSSTYENYFINANFSNFSADGTVGWRMRASGSDNSTSNYYTALSSLNISGGTDNITASAIADGYLCRTDVQTNQYWTSNIWISAPQLTQITTLLLHSVGLTNASLYIHHTGMGAFGATTSFDSMSFYPTSGTFSGKIRVFGVQQ